VHVQNLIIDIVVTLIELKRISLLALRREKVVHVLLLLALLCIRVHLTGCWRLNERITSRIARIVVILGIVERRWAITNRHQRLRL